MLIHKLPIGPLESNTYIIEDNKDAILVDVSDYTEPVLEILKERNLTVQALLCTHIHFDHVAGVAEFIRLTNAKAYAGQGDIDMKDSFLPRSSMFGFPPVEPFDVEPLTEGMVQYGSITCQQIATPGHSKGGFCFYFSKANTLISGDTLFKRSVGRTDFPGGSSAELINSIKTKLFLLPDDTIVYPGHGEASTIGSEKQSNPYL